MADRSEMARNVIESEIRIKMADVCHFVKHFKKNGQKWDPR